MDTQKTTVKTQAADDLAELRDARNKLAIAISKASKSHSTVDLTEVSAARSRVLALEKKYMKTVDEREKRAKKERAALLEKQCEKQKNYKRSSAWKLPFGRR